VNSWPLLRRLVRAQWLDRYAGTWAGALWGVVLPVGQMAVFWLVFSEWMAPRLGALQAQLGKGGYAVYLLTGLIFWWWWSNGLMRAAGAIADGAGLAKKTPIRLWWLVAAAVVAEGLSAGLALLALLMGLLVLGYAHVSWLGLLPLVAAALWVIFWVGLLLAVVSVFVPDVREVLGLVLNLWFWLTPIVYLPEGAPALLHGVLALNPAAWLVTAAHDLVVWGRWPEVAVVAKLIGLAVVSAAVAYWVWRRAHAAVRDVL
jgi:lipopolysaccharide transport system permease protein